MYFTHLVFRGPQKPPAAIEFGLGLNLIYGPSNTGKSSILDAIDFMFGRTRLLKELPQHDGYDEIFLGVNFTDDGPYTLVRSMQGGKFTCFEGTHFERPGDQKGEILRPGDPSKTMGSIRDFILDRLDLAGKELKKNQRNEKARLTLRNLAPLVLVNERDIQRESSPYVSDQYTSFTIDKSRLRLLLTGVDDSKLIPEEKDRIVIFRQARLQLLSEFIEESSEQISVLGGGDNLRSDMEDQLDRLVESLRREREVLSSTESQYRQALSVRSEMRVNYAEAEDRLAEISEMLARFSLLEEQYSTDLLRLENIREAGTLFFALPSEKCPVCGAKAGDHDPTGDCDAGTELIVAAAEGEQMKIRSLESELKDVIATLNKEKLEVQQQLPELLVALQKASSALGDISPQEDDEDDLTGTDVNLRFLESLATWTSIQTIIFENKKSVPERFSEGEGITRFTKSETQGRYGFFPLVD